MLIKGDVVFKGYCYGKVFLLHNHKICINKNKIKYENIDYEISRFLKAHKKTINQFNSIKSIISDEDKKILFEGYILLLEDKCFIDDVIYLIKNKMIYADSAVNKVIKNQVNDIKKVNNIYIRDRINDILDIGKRLIYNIYNIKLVDFNFFDIKENIIIVSREIFPSQIVQFNLKKIVGFITELGSLTSHTSILSKSLELVNIINVKNITKILCNNDFLIIDGMKGNIYINPDKYTFNNFKLKLNKFLVNKNKLNNLNLLPAITKDGHRIKLFANIGDTKDINNIFKYGCEGIGLYRTEFLFMNRNSFPSEEEQFLSYKKVIEYMNGKVVTIRTFDLGGDKFLPYMKFPKDNVPFLGWRSIRIYKNKIDIFHTQLRAILRSSIYGNVRIMFPMIISIEEVLFLKKELSKVKFKLKNDNIPFDSNIKIGAMIETPSASLIINHLSKELDFFSIGTNDLTQYTLAVDRNNSMVSYLYEPLSPSIIYLIKSIVKSAHLFKKEVGMCGELASNEDATLLLLGLGLDELSMSANYIPKIKYNIRNFLFSESKKISNLILKESKVNNIKLILSNYLNKFKK